MVRSVDHRFTLRDLVFYSSINDTYRTFTESDVLTWSIFPVKDHPLANRLVYSRKDMLVGPECPIEGSD